MFIYSAAMTAKTIPWELIEALLAERKRDRAWLLEGLKVETNNVTNWKSRGVPARRAAAIASLLGTTSDYLLQVPGAQRHQGSNVLVMDSALSPVPLISWVQAGEWCEAQDPFNVGDAEEWLPCPVRHGPRTYALCVRGESMHDPGGKPSFEDGDVIFVDPDLGAAHKSLVIAKLDPTNEATFKRLLIDGSTWYLEALNPSWPSRIMRIESESHICGVVIARLESFV